MILVFLLLVTIHLNTGTTVVVNQWWETGDGKICWEKHGGVVCVRKDSVREITSGGSDGSVTTPGYFPQGKEKKIDERTEARLYLYQAAAQALLSLDEAGRYLYYSKQHLREASTRYYLVKACSFLREALYSILTAHNKWDEILERVDVQCYKKVIDEFRKYLQAARGIVAEQELTLSDLTQKQLTMRVSIDDYSVRELMREVKESIREDERRMEQLEEDLRKVIREEVETELWLEEYYNK